MRRVRGSPRIRALCNVHHIHRIDSRAGAWTSSSLGLGIEYDIGELAGERANAARQDEYQWFRSGEIDGESFHAALSKTDDRETFLFVTFPRPSRAQHGGDRPVNLWVEVRGNEDTELLLRHLLAFSRNVPPG